MIVARSLIPWSILCYHLINMNPIVFVYIYIYIYISRQFSTGAKLSVQDTSAEMSWIRTVLGPKCIYTLHLIVYCFGCRSFRVSGPTIWNDLPVDIWSTDITREQFKRSLKIWLFECAYGRRRIWETVQSDDVPNKSTYLLTYYIRALCSIVSVLSSVTACYWF